MLGSMNVIHCIADKLACKVFPGRSGRDPARGHGALYFPLPERGDAHHVMIRDRPSGIGALLG